MWPGKNRSVSEAAWRGALVVLIRNLKLSEEIVCVNHEALKQLMYGNVVCNDNVWGSVVVVCAGIDCVAARQGRLMPGEVIRMMRRVAVRRKANGQHRGAC